MIMRTGWTNRSRTSRGAGAYILVVLTALMSVGCESSMKVIKKHIPFMEPDTNITLTLAASSDINPDTRGEASPLNVKTYLLSERTTFDNLGFEAALDEADVLLSDQLLSRKEYIFQPKESIQYSIKLGKESKFIAVIAAYRDVDQSKWKLVLPVDSEDPEDQTVSLGKNSVVLAQNTEKDEQEDNTIDAVEDGATDKIQEKTGELVESRLESAF